MNSLRLQNLHASVVLYYRKFFQLVRCLIYNCRAFLRLATVRLCFGGGGVNSIKSKTLVGLRLNTTYKLIKGDLRTDAKGRIPGLVVMGDNSCLKGCGFESQHHILDEHDIFCIDFCKKCIVCSKETENKQKEAGVGPFKKRCICTVA